MMTKTCNDHTFRSFIVKISAPYLYSFGRSYCELEPIPSCGTTEKKFWLCRCEGYICQYTHGALPLASYVRQLGPAKKDKYSSKFLLSPAKKIQNRSYIFKTKNRTKKVIHAKSERQIYSKNLATFEESLIFGRHLGMI